MSFIYAEKYYENGSNNESVRILCDTKTTLTNYSSANFSSIAHDLIDPADTNNKNLFGLKMPMLVITNDAGEIVRYMQKDKGAVGVIAPFVVLKALIISGCGTGTSYSITKQYPPKHLQDRSCQTS